MKMPTKILVYVCDYDDKGVPVLAVVKSEKEIPDDYSGGVVGEYKLESAGTLTVTRALKPCSKNQQI